MVLVIVLGGLYALQLISLLWVISDDTNQPKHFKTIKTKNDFLIRLIPFGFLIGLYVYYKNLD